jgi:hypothetical protein
MPPYENSHVTETRHKPIHNGLWSPPSVCAHHSKGCWNANLYCKKHFSWKFVGFKAHVVTRGDTLTAAMCPKPRYNEGALCYNLFL